MRRARALLLALFAALAACSPFTTTPTTTTPAAPPPAALVEAGTLAAAALEEQSLPGLALVVLHGDELLLARGYGREDVAREDEVTPRTVFMLNSISKQLVAAVVLQLAEEGRLGLEEPVARHLPEFTELPRSLEVRHLLSHTSGLRDEHVQPELVALYERPGTTFAEYAAAARRTPVDFAPSSRWSYANVNYLLLTLLVERLEGQPLEAALATRLFEPLALDSFQVCPDQPGGERGRARGHVLREGALVPHPPENVALFRGSGGFCGSALDLARWTRALAAGRVVSAESYRRMTTPAPLSGGRSADYGLAASLVAPDGVRRIGHGGYGGGFSAQAAYYPEAALTVVVVANRFAFPEHVERRVSRRLLGRPEPALADVPLPAHERRRLAGAYDVGVHGSPVSVLEREGRLWFSLPSPPIELPLRHVGGGELVSALDPDGFRLSFSADGRELRLLGMGMMTWYGVREPPRR